MSSLYRGFVNMLKYVNECSFEENFSESTPKWHLLPEEGRLDVICGFFSKAFLTGCCKLADSIAGNDAILLKSGLFFFILVFIRIHRTFIFQVCKFVFGQPFF